MSRAPRKPTDKSISCLIEWLNGPSTSQVHVDVQNLLLSRGKVPDIIFNKVYAHIIRLSARVFLEYKGRTLAEMKLQLIPVLSDGQTVEVQRTSRALLELCVYLDRHAGKSPILCCAICGKWFHAHRVDTLTCSLDCSDRRAYRLYRNRTGEAEYKRRLAAAGRKFRRKQKK